MNTEKPSSIRIKTMEISGVNIAKRPKDLSPKASYLIGLESNTNINEPKKLIIVIVTMKILNKDDSIEVAVIQLSIAFEATDFDSLITKLPDNKFSMDYDFEKRLAFDSINTLRGVAFSLLRGTYLQKIIIPIINESELQRNAI